MSPELNYSWLHLSYDWIQRKHYVWSSWLLLFIPVFRKRVIFLLDYKTFAKGTVHIYSSNAPDTGAQTSTSCHVYLIFLYYRHSSSNEFLNINPEIYDYLVIGWIIKTRFMILFSPISNVWPQRWDRTLIGYAPIKYLKNINILNSSNVSETWDLSLSPSYLKSQLLGILKNGPVLSYFWPTFVFWLTLFT